MIEEILEVAYLKDPKLFDRDANTKRSKARADLRAETGRFDHDYLKLLPCRAIYLIDHRISNPQAGTTDNSKDGGSCSTEM